MNKQFCKNAWLYLLISLLLFVPIFQHIGYLPIRLWDESRLAISAYEMYHHGNYLVPTFDGEPDMWNTKPPFMIWVQVLCMKLLGISEFSIRLPSALAAFFTCIFLLLFSVRYAKSIWLGVIFALALVTTPAYINAHAAQTGDYDALFTLFIILSCFSFFSFLENSKNLYLYLFFLTFTLAFLTKIFVFLIILPGLFIYVVIQKKIIILFKNKHLYVGFLGFLVFGIGYFLLREIYNPGYIEAAWNNDFGGRFLSAIEKHNQSFWFYIMHRFNIWLLFIPFGIIVGLLNKDERIKKLTLFTTVNAVTFFLVISSAKTKLSWYALPLYPFIAILAGIFIYFVFSLLKENKKITHYLQFKTAPYILVLLVFFMPYILIFKKTYQQKETADEFYQTSYYLRDILNDKRKGERFTVLYDDYPAHIMFYINVLNDKGKHISLRNSNEVQTGETILTAQNHTKEFLETHYNYDVIDEFKNIKVYKILEEKQLQE
jgi:4-amino-4-deoxy-L-arabinose transferase-like glycosyltransferase